MSTDQVPPKLQSCRVGAYIRDAQIPKSVLLQQPSELFLYQNYSSEIAIMLPDSASIEAASTGRLNLKFLGYCLIVGFAATAFGFDQGETSGFLAMPQ
jgi:hypothetical protein